MRVVPLALLLAGGARAEEPELENWQRERWGGGGLPALNYNSDEGFGFGVVGSLYRYNGEVAPYKTAVNLVIFATTFAVHSHSLEIDTLEVGDLPLRVKVRAELETTRAGNFCGFGPDVACDPDAIPPALAGTDAADDYYKIRYLYPKLRADLRWALDPMPHRVEVFGGWRGGRYMSGDFKETAPYPDSLYADTIPGGEDVVVSVLQAGLMVDNRDNEPAPKRGYWVEASLRGASRILGADFGYFGFNTTLRGYLPLTSNERLVLADRVVLDGQIDGATKDIPTNELSVPGGFDRYRWYGSLNAGRGIRLARYLGRVMAMEQAELRYTWLSVKFLGAPFEITNLVFSDVGWVADDFDTIGDSARLLPGQGGGFRFAFDRNFIVRVDVGVSALEDYAPSVYIDLRNTF